MLKCFKCTIVMDDGSNNQTEGSYCTENCIIFSDNIAKCPNIIYDNFIKTDNINVINMSIEEIELTEGMLINIK